MITIDNNNNNNNNNHISNLTGNIHVKGNVHVANDSNNVTTLVITTLL